MCPDLDSPRKRTNNQFPTEPSPPCGLDPQLFSIYIDEELPSPWKEKLEAHTASCLVCKERLENLKQLKGKLSGNDKLEEHSKEAMERVWQNFQAGKNSFRSHRMMQQQRRRMWKRRLWQAKLSIPIPAAAAIVVLILAVLFTRGNSGSADNFAGNIDSSYRTNIILAAEEAPIFPTVDLNSVVQYLLSESTDIIILRLPENRNFSRYGDPAIIRAADFRRFP